MADENVTTSDTQVPVDPKIVKRILRRRHKRGKETVYFQVCYDHTLPDGRRAIYDALSPRLYSKFQCKKELKKAQRSNPEAYSARCRIYHR
jgi:hypothetical protein